MSARCFILLLSLSLSFQQDVKLSVTTVLQYNLSNPDSVTIVCQYDFQKNWIVFMKLLGSEGCETSKAATCQWSQEGNQTTFILKNHTSAQTKYYHCEGFRRSPLPVISGKGKTFRLFPEKHNHPNISCTNVDCPPPEVISRSDSLVWAWALIGLMLLLCLYSLLITALYIKLKIERSEDLNDTLTYVPMQVKPKKPVRRHDADKNAEYMDMRKVHSHAGPIRDMNHNSHRIPAGFIM